MKTITPAMRGHLDDEVTTLTTCWKLVRTDGEVFAFTEGTRSLDVDGTVYSPAGGFVRSAITSDDSLSVANLEADGFFDDDAIKETELRAGLFRHAQVYVFAVNWADLSMGTIPLHRGRLGETVSTKTGVFKAELRGLTAALTQTIGEVYTPGCRVALGDPIRCRVPLLPPVLARSAPVDAPTVSTREVSPMWRVPDLDMDQVDVDGNADSRVYHDVMFLCTTEGTTASVQPDYDYTVGNFTIDGTAIFKAVEAWTRTAIVDSVASVVSFTVDYAYPDPRMVNDCFLEGLIQFESGRNAGASVECKSSTLSSGTLVCFLEGRYIPEIGDRITVNWGCDKTLSGAAGCALRFGNQRFFQGEPMVPGADQLLYYPNAGGGGTAYEDPSAATDSLLGAAQMVQ